MTSHGARDSQRAGHGRTGAVIAALLGGTVAAGTLAALLVLRLQALHPGRGTWRVDAVTEVAVTTVGVLVAGWLACSAVVAAACLLLRAAGARWRTGERLVHRYAPHVVRKALALTVGAGIGLGMATGASAAPQPAPPAAVTVTAAPADLGWVVTDASAVQDPPAPTAAATAAPTAPDAAPPGLPLVADVTRAEHPAPTTAGTVLVHPGDTLWAIAARHLPHDATEAQIATAWPRWYEANRDVVGADPDVLHPGQVLTVPAAGVSP
ncbi:LysM peptidoglycan-binding domain-containing protein [Cellulomonas fengjieae]|uniref:LysM peptidoglycan-binding domain-containing protein n=1 Tax=Cellulomonas fengjieae TaxID=2819978 RepID=UPI001AAE5AC3|nr:LysM domain-containing protein [Cellulomonas fengjieae]MBO3101355.1 LysM peptidoglycan-binding domain-containing protein [Cellulomonas fengjieae]